MAGQPLSVTRCGQKEDKPAAPENTKEITNSIGMKLRLLPAGKFIMGSPDSEQDFHNGGFQPKRFPETQHEVTLTKPFHMGIFEVTQESTRR